MTFNREFRIDALLYMQRALWQMVTPELRGVAIKVGENLVHGRMIYEREPTEDERELVSEVETELIADFLPQVEVVVVPDWAPPPPRVELQPGEEWVYLRRETGRTLGQ